jgi:hypothetical protein
VIVVSVHERECRFALEYERTQKANGRYREIQTTIQAETDVRHFLYLVSNYDLLLFVKKFAGCHPVYFGLETHPESPPATMGSSFGGPNGGLEDQQKVEKVLDFSCIYDIT